MAHVRGARLRHRVVVDIDHVVEHAHRRADGSLQLRHVQLAVDQMLRQVHRAQVAHGDFVARRVQRDLGAQVR